jgi:hypothetical protein
MATHNASDIAAPEYPSAIFLPILMFLNTVDSPAFFRWRSLAIARAPSLKTLLHSI